MPKEKKVAKRGSHAPLGQQILQADAPRAIARVKQRMKQREEEEQDAEQYVESKMTHKILKQARDQQNDDQASDDLSDADVRPAMADSDEEDEGDKDGGDIFEGDDQQYEQHLNIAPEDEEALQMFMSREPKNRISLSDIIMSKIREKETEIASQISDGPKALDDRIKRVYESVGEILSRYRSGKLPKAFKIIPSLKNWEEVLHITQPEMWTAAAVFNATRIFASNLHSSMAQRFYNLVLLPRVRDDIAEYKRLNFQLFMALKKALFKPAAFYKGILLPLCEAGDCSMREAIIISGALARTSIPVLQSAAAMLKIAEMPYNGANSIFLRVLLDKKYALPYRVIDALVFHFLRFQKDRRALPVLWHQCFLVFVQRYKEDISSEQKEALLELLKSQSHPAITPEIRRELVHSRSRDAEQIYVESHPEES